MWIADISDLAGRDAPARRGRAKLQFLGQIVSAASLLTSGEFQVSAVDCRRRPNRRRCCGSIRLGRDAQSDDIHWSCPDCRDHGVITNWRGSQWDLTAELKNGHLISLSQERARRAGRLPARGAVQVLELEVELLHAPVPLEEPVARRIVLSGDHSLHDLHLAIQGSFEREEEEAYEFMFGAPYDPDTRRFIGEVDALDDEQPLCEARETALDALSLNAGDTFGYLLDFTEEWVHRVAVLATEPARGRRVSPRITRRVGQAPPSLEEMEQEWDDSLMWEEVEETYPLTGLYGPYRADEELSPDEWLALDDLERHLLVMEAHSHSLPADHPPVASMLLHAVVHVMAEDHLATLSRPKAQAKLSRLHSDAIGRHRALHALGQTLVREQLGGISDPCPPSSPRKSKPHISPERSG